jgi:hypothetical protein
VGIHYENLDEVTRSFMLEESHLGGHYQSPRLNNAGLARWVPLLEEAIQLNNDDWLSNELLRSDSFNDQESYITRSGNVALRRINKQHSAQMLAEGEFNRYYLRGLCRRAAEEGKSHLIIYRGKQVANPRPESAAKVGTQVGVLGLITILRRNDFVSIEEAFAVPGGPNSGLTARLP